MLLQKILALFSTSVLLSAATVYAGAGASTTVTPPTPAPQPPPNHAGQQQVLLVGNNWEGTASVIQANYPFSHVGSINIVPDKDARMTEIYTNPININLTTGAVNWRFPVAGYRSDHMALSPDGTRVAVSASIANVVHVLDVYTGAEIGRFKAGTNPHENFWTDGGDVVWNSSIGNVESNLDAPWEDFTKGDRHITVVNITQPGNFQIIRTINMRPLLDAVNRSDLSNAVRPAVFTADHQTVYFQVSFFNGFIQYSVPSNSITNVVTLPGNATLTSDRTKWVLDSRHHGISMQPGGKKLCVAGTMDSYATVVEVGSWATGPLVYVARPYWATVSGDGRHCIVSDAGSNQTLALDFETGNLVATIPVGYHPQRVRAAWIPDNWKSIAKYVNLL
ncbi:putative serine/threonine protein kinase [Irineochytrium annulatum]|nr:putative serine/threonine protein kinase [Irineochytrium annulatum]